MQDIPYGDEEDPALAEPEHSLLAPIGFGGGFWLRSRPWAKEQFKRDAERRGHPTYGIMDTMVEVVEVRCCMELNIGGHN